jgi:hypothetical protein
LSKAWRATVRLGDVVVFENRQPVTVAKFINESSLFFLLPGVIRRLELKPNNEQKVEHIFIAPPYCQTACYTPVTCPRQKKWQLNIIPWAGGQRKLYYSN